MLTVVFKHHSHIREVFFCGYTDVIHANLIKLIFGILWYSFDVLTPTGC